MKCIYCNHPDSKVVDSRTSEGANSIRRRRECVKCGKRFTSYETVEMVPLLVVKSDGSRQAFNIMKIKNGILKACEKRPVTADQINELVDSIEKKLLGSLEQEVQSAKIGDLVMERLKKLDEIAYVRFAAVYRQFTDLSMLLDFVKGIEKENKVG